MVLARRPAHGAERRRLLRLIQLHDASNIGRIVEPFAAGGVIIPPAGYLQRLREICTKYDILLIPDEVITGFGRAGAYTGSGVRAARYPNVAKQITNGSRSAQSLRRRKSTTRSWPRADLSTAEFPHGYTYWRIRSRRPASPRSTCSCRRMRSRASGVAPYFENAHSLSARNDRRAQLRARRCLNVEAWKNEPAKRPYERDSASPTDSRPLRRRHDPARAAVHRRETRDRSARRGARRSDRVGRLIDG